jgi:predicted transcriptional regulator
MPPTKSKSSPVVASAVTTKEPLNELDYFAPITRRVYQDPRWSAKPPAAAWRVYCWFVDRTTCHYDMESEDGSFFRYGGVNGRVPVPFTTISTNLHCSWRSVQRACDWLMQVGFISRVRTGKGKEYEFAVVNSTRKLKGEVKKYTRVEQQEAQAQQIEFLDETTATTTFNILRTKTMNSRSRVSGTRQRCPHG